MSFCSAFYYLWLHSGAPLGTSAVADVPILKKPISGKTQDQMRRTWNPYFRQRLWIPGTATLGGVQE
jgi:hypothetical protein